MINVAEVVNDPDFTQPFQIKRVSGQFANEGEWTTSSVTLDRVGVIQPSKSDDVLNFLQEGERLSSAISIYCTQDILIGDGQDIQSDIIIWRSREYRVAYCKPWDMNGYWFAIAVGMTL